MNGMRRMSSSIHTATHMTLNEQARAILAGNDRGGYTLPTDGLYPFQWNWDASVTALGWMCCEPARAWEEMRWLFKGQWQGGPNDGFLAHIAFHAPSDSYFPGADEWGTDGAPGTETIGTRTSSISQPPLHATMVRWMWQRAQATSTAAAEDAARQVRALLPRLLAHHRWWYRTRDPRQTGLVVNIHPWETGMDNSPAWDAPLAHVPQASRPYTRRDLGHVDASMRPPQSFYDRVVYLMDFNRAQHFDPVKILAACPYRVNDIGIISILQRATIDLLALCETCGWDANLQDLHAELHRTQRAVEGLWSGRWGQYVSRDAITGALLDVPTSSGLLGAYAGFDRDLGPTVAAWLAETPHALPSTRSVFSGFEPLRYWRGPVWQHMNMLIADGLQRQGHAELALAIQARSAALFEASGFHEYYDPLTGAGLGGSAFSWTAATYLYWINTMATSTELVSVERTTRPWGWYATVLEAPGYKVKRIGVRPGQRISLQKHLRRAEHWVVVRGTATVTVGDALQQMQPGQHIDIAVGQVHRLANDGTEPVEIMEIQFGSYLGEDDIVRLQDDYGRS